MAKDQRCSIKSLISIGPDWVSLRLPKADWQRWSRFISAIMRESCQYCLCVRGCVGVPELDIIRFLLFVHILAVHDSCWHRAQKYRLCDLNKSRCTQIAVAWSQRYERTHHHPSVGLLVCRRHHFAAGWLIAMINGRTDGWRNERWRVRNVSGMYLSNITRARVIFFWVSTQLWLRVWYCSSINKE